MIPTQKKLADVISVIRDIWTSKHYPLIDPESPASVKYIESPPTFIHPKLRVIKENKDSPYVIISAPGAVGKTTFAEHCSHAKKSYYWDLSTLKLGDNTFIGTIAQCFGPLKLSEILKDLSEGQVTFFLDAFDEAEIISGWSGIEKFITEIYEYTRVSPRPNVILFSRSETATLLQLHLEIIGSEDCYSMYEIDYFDEIGAKNFVQMFLKNLKDENYEKHKIPFEQAITNIFKTIGKGVDDQEEDIWKNEEIRSFIGYSPVLQTIASYMRGQNYEEIAIEFQEKNSTTEGFKVIAEFIGDLLEREQNKVINAVKQKVSNIPEGWEDWTDLIYNSLDQIKFITTYLGQKRNFDFLTDLKSIPGWLKEDYIDSIKQFLPNHPFIRDGKFSSPAFRDYILGTLLNDSQYETQCKGYIRNGKFVLTPLFSYFYGLKTSNVCKGSHAGYIYDSASSKLGFNDNMLLTFIKPKEEDIYSLEIINTSGAKINSLEFDCVINDTYPLTFERRLHNAIIKVDHSIILGNTMSSFELSDVEIESKKLILEAREYIFNCRDQSNVILKTDQFIQKDYSLAINKKGSGDLIINWPEGNIYPWNDYYQDLSNESNLDFKDELYALKRILVPFRKHSKGEFGKQYEFIDNVIVKDSDLRKNLLTYLLSNKIITKRSSQNVYILSEEKLKENGLNWSDLKSLSLNENSVNFIRKFKEDQ